MRTRIISLVMVLALVFTLLPVYAIADAVSVTKMGRNGHVTTEILVKICAALDCRIEDIVEIVPDHN